VDCETLTAKLNLILAPGWVWVAGSNFTNDLFQSIQSNFIEGIQAHAQVACWKPFFIHPDQVVLGDIAEQSSLVLAKGHALRDDINQDLGIHVPKSTPFSLR
jgi:hypothetical protein